MEREVQRRCKLPSFELHLATLDVLFNRIIALFDSTDEVYSSIDIPLKGEKLTFASVEEMRSYPELRGRIRNFTLWFSQAGKRVSIDCSGFLGSAPSVTATAETEAWCAGAIETVRSFFQTHRVWYHWFRSLPFGWLLLGAANVPGILIWARIAKKDLLISTTLIYAWAVTVLALAVLYLGKIQLLPAATLVITEEEGFLRRKAPELSLAIALLAAVLTIIGWFIGK